MQNAVRTAWPKRSRSWNLGLAEDLRDEAFAREFLQAAMDEGVPIKNALRKVIWAAGVSVVARRAGMPASDVQRALRPGHSPSQITLDRLLMPFGLALGAMPRQIARLVIGQAAAVVGGCIVVGLVGGWFVSRALTGLVIGVSPTDPANLAASAGLLGGLALLGCWWPARRALRVTPIEALRED